MSSFPVDRTHPPSRLVYRDASRQLTLRPWAFADTDALIDAVVASRAELLPFGPWAQLPITRESEYELVAKFQADYHAGRDYGLGMFSEAGEVLGGVGVHARVPLNPRGLEVGYWCHSAHAGRGWTTLAVRMATVLVFDHFACDRFAVTHDEANSASQRVVEKCGFVFEGVVRNVVAAASPELRAGGYRGTGRQRLYALTPDDVPGLSWVPEVRAGITVYDALGAAHDPRRG